MLLFYLATLAGLILERMRAVNAVLFDKTGTLARGQPAVIDLAAVDDTDAGRTRLLALAGAVEVDAEHPWRGPSSRPPRPPGPPLWPATSARSPVAACRPWSTARRSPSAGRPCSERPGELAERTRPWSARGAAVLYVVADGEVVGALGRRVPARVPGRHRRPARPGHPRRHDHR